MNMEVNRKPVVKLNKLKKFKQKTSPTAPINTGIWWQFSVKPLGRIRIRVLHSSLVYDNRTIKYCRNNSGLYVPAFSCFSNTNMQCCGAGAGRSRSRYFLVGAGAGACVKMWRKKHVFLLLLSLFWYEEGPEPVKKKYLEPEPFKSGPAPQHCQHE